MIRHLSLEEVLDFIASPCNRLAGLMAFAISEALSRLSFRRT
jgi:hypothetical protein